MMRMLGFLLHYRRVLERMAEEEEKTLEELLSETVSPGVAAKWKALTAL